MSKTTVRNIMFLVVVCILAVNVIACDDGGTDAAAPTTAM